MSLLSETEATLFGTLWEDPGALESLDLRPEHIQSPKWSAALSAALSVSAGGVVPDPITVAERMRRDGVKVEMADLLGTLGSPSRLEEYARIIRDAWLVRQIKLAVGAASKTLRDGATGKDVLSVLEGELSNIHESVPVAGVHLADGVRDRYAQLAKIASGEVAPGIPSKMPGLGAIQTGIVTLVAARPAMGKSAFALSLTRNIAEDGFPVHVFSLEDSREAYMDRVIAQVAGVPAAFLRAPKHLTREHLERLKTVTARVAGWGWRIDDQAGVTAQDIVLQVRRQRRHLGTRVVVVDYVQRLTPTKPGRREDEELAQSMRILADAAKNDDIAYVVLAQLNRQVEHRDGRKPQLSDLRGSGGLEELAKAVWLLQRPAYYDERLPDDCLDVFVAKNSQGPTGTVRLQWEPETMRVF